MRIRCFTAATLLLLTGGCSSPSPEETHEAYYNDRLGLLITIVYVCNPNLEPTGRTLMQVEAESSSDQAIPLVTTRDIDGWLDERTEHALSPGTTDTLEEVVATNHTVDVHVYLGEEVTEIATATFRSDDHKCHWLDVRSEK